MSYYLHRATPIDNWRVYLLDHILGHSLPRDGEVIELPDCHWFLQAQAKADKRNGKGNSEQGVLAI